MPSKAESYQKAACQSTRGGSGPRPGACDFFMAGLLIYFIGNAYRRSRPGTGLPRPAYRPDGPRQCPCRRRGRIGRGHGPAGLKDRQVAGVLGGPGPSPGGRHRSARRDRRSRAGGPACRQIPAGGGRRRVGGAAKGGGRGTFLSEVQNRRYFGRQKGRCASTVGPGSRHGRPDPLLGRSRGQTYNHQRARVVFRALCPPWIYGSYRERRSHRKYAGGSREKRVGLPARPPGGPVVRAPAGSGPPVPGVPGPAAAWTPTAAMQESTEVHATCR